MTKDDLIAAIPDIRTDMAKIRRRFVGATLDTKKLAQLGFAAEAGHASISRWKRMYHSTGGGLAFFCDVSLGTSDDGAFLTVQSANSCQERYPEGWGGTSGVDLEDRLGGSIGRKLTKDLETAVVELPPNDIASASDLHLDVPDIPESFAGRPHDWIAAHLIDASYRHQAMNERQAYLLVLLLRNIDRITLEACYTNLLGFAHGLRMREESATVARALLALDSPLESLRAETLTNLGNVYCDRLAEYEAALWCFETAIARDPSLPQPRQGIRVVRGKFR